MIEENINAFCMQNIQYLFHPTSIAVIGASRRVGNVGNDIVKNLVGQGFDGEIYPVNPQAQELYGRKCFPSVSALESIPELAIVVVPASVAVSVVRECAHKGVRAIIVISAGFREVGNARAEEEMREICDEYGIALLGPNCLGVIHPAISMNASFASRMPEKGHVAFLSQSGALCTAMLDYAVQARVGFSKFASIGNKAQIGERELMRFLVHDPDTKAVALYVESLEDAQGFIDATQELKNAGKTVFVVKSGATSAGASASASHTGSLAGNDAVYDAVFEKAGAIRVRDFDDLFEMFSGFVSDRRLTGKRVAVLTNAGGPGVLTTDEIVLRELEVACISEEGQQKLKTFLPPASSVHNPVDILGDALADRYAKALDVMLEEKGVDAIVVVLTPQSMTQIAETARVIADRARGTNVFLYAVFMGSADVEEGIEILRGAGVATSRFPQKAIRVFAEMYRMRDDAPIAKIHTSSNLEKQEEVDAILAKYPKGGSMSGDDAMLFFSGCGFAVTRSAVARNAFEAREAVETVGGRAVMKIISPHIEHKSDVGGVVLGVTPETAQEACESLMTRVAQKAPNASLEGVLVAEMIIEKGVEFILGSVRDPNLGHAVMVGFGGIYVEVFRDVAFGLIPVSRVDAKNMIEKLKSKALLRGARGGEVLDENALLDAIVRFGHMLERYPNIAEADMNPVLVLPRGTRVLDARVRVD